MTTNQPGTAPATDATDAPTPLTPATPCYVCGGTDPSAHGPNDECPDLAADQAWLDDQIAKRAR